MGVVAAGLLTVPAVPADDVDGVEGATGVADVESDDPPSTPTRTTMSATNAAASATTAITTGRGTRLVVAAMVFTRSLSARTPPPLIPRWAMCAIRDLRGPAVQSRTPVDE